VRPNRQNYLTPGNTPPQEIVISWAAGNPGTGVVASSPPELGVLGLKGSVTESECKIYKWIYVNTYMYMYTYIREQHDWMRDPGRCALFYLINILLALLETLGAQHMSCVSTGNFHHLYSFHQQRYVVSDTRALFATRPYITRPRPCPLSWHNDMPPDQFQPLWCCWSQIHELALCKEFVGM